MVIVLARLFALLTTILLLAGCAPSGPMYLDFTNERSEKIHLYHLRIDDEMDVDLPLASGETGRVEVSSILRSTMRGDDCKVLGIYCNLGETGELCYSYTESDGAFVEYCRSIDFCRAKFGDDHSQSDQATVSCEDGTLNVAIRADGSIG
jgi:hypothetical protein